MTEALVVALLGVAGLTVVCLHLIWRVKRLDRAVALLREPERGWPPMPEPLPPPPPPPPPERDPGYPRSVRTRRIEVVHYHDGGLGGDFY